MKDSNPKHEFVIGDCGAVSLSEKGEIDLSFLAWQCAVDDIRIPRLRPSGELVDIGPITREQAYLLGKALLVVAKAAGINE